MDRNKHIFFICWTVFLALASGFIAIYLPLEVIYGKSMGRTSDILYWLSNAILILDIPVSFQKTKEGQSDFGLIQNISTEGYMKKWFPIDFISAIPFELFVGNPFIPLLRLIKLVKVAFMMRLLKYFELRYSSQLVMIFFIYWLSIGAHWISCGWLAIRGIDPSTDLTTNYIKSIYWVITTLASVGYGDITPNNNTEYIYTIFVELMGIGVFGYVIGYIASLLTRKDPATIQYLENMDKLQALIKYRDLPTDLQLKLNNYYSYQWRKRLGYDESSFLEDLPYNLRREISLHLKKEVVENISLFEDASEELMTELALNLSPLVLTPNDCLFQAGDTSDGMYFVITGQLIAINKEGTIELGTFDEGDFFGEIALFRDTPRTAAIRATAYSDLYKLDKSIFTQLMEKYPAIRNRIEEKVVARELEHRQKSN